MSPLNRWTVRLSIALAVLHFIAAAALTYWPRLLSEGWFDTRLNEPVRDSTLWFTFGGIGLLAIISLARMGIRATGRMPVQAGVYLLAIGIPLTVFQPVSGGIAVVAVGVMAVIATARPAKTAPAAS